ncbi:MAG TPA: histidine phosphatase family protein [Acidimicrobiales bacterium]|nr:histidine phosphatase family protein [Acidimicrobiales bacterium]
MTRVLWVLRHAKTVADPPPGGTDHDRTLAPRGRRDAEALGRRLAGDRLGLDRDGAPLPELVLCSTAARTRQTADLVLAGLVGAPLVDVRRAVYYASPDQVLAEIRTVPDDVTSAMVVGHNPTAHALAAGLGTDDDRVTVEGRGFPTCALAVFRLPVARWSDVAEQAGHLAGLFTPPY